MTSDPNRSTGDDGRHPSAIAPLRLIGEDRFDGGGQGADICVRNCLAPAGHRDDLATAAVVADDDRRSAQQGFERDKAEDFVTGRIDDDGSGSERVKSFLCPTATR